MSENIRQKDGNWLKILKSQISTNKVGGFPTLVESQNYLGVPSVISSDGFQKWIPGARFEMWRLPLHCTDHVSKDLLKRLFKIKRTFVVSYLVEPDNKHQANCFHYIVRDKNYSLKKLSRNTRSKIRRGLKNFTIRLTSWDELKEKGFPALEDTDARHGYSAPDADTLERIAKQRAGSDNHQLWSAWDGDNLAAWIEWIRVDNWALIGRACSQTKYLRKYPNNSLIYAATWYFLNEHKCSYVSYGISSIEARSNTLVSLHGFKRQMGYEAIPTHRHFIPKNFLRPILRFKTCSIIWETFSLFVPQSSALRKIAGMARLISGREKTPLAWAEGLEQ